MAESGFIQAVRAACSPKLTVPWGVHCRGGDGSNNSKPYSFVVIRPRRWRRRVRRPCSGARDSLDPRRRRLRASQGRRRPIADAASTPSCPSDRMARSRRARSRQAAVRGGSRPVASCLRPDAPAFVRSSALNAAPASGADSAPDGVPSASPAAGGVKAEDPPERVSPASTPQSPARANDTGPLKPALRTGPLGDRPNRSFALPMLPEGSPYAGDAGLIAHRWARRVDNACFQSKAEMCMYQLAAYYVAEERW